MENEGDIKKFMYVNRKAPYGTIYALESLEVVLIGAAFDQDVSLAFLDDGVGVVAAHPDGELGVLGIVDLHRGAGRIAGAAADALLLVNLQ